MAIPPYLQEKLSRKKKRSKGKILFNLILIASLGLNVYLLNSPQNPGLPQASESLNIEVAKVQATCLVECGHVLPGI